MTLVNSLNKAKSRAVIATPEWQEGAEALIKMLAPIAPHIAEELWQRGGFEGSVHLQGWPGYDEEALEQDSVTLAVQVNGKRRGEVTVPKDATKDAVLAAAKAAPNIAKYVDGAHIVREIVVPGRLVNIVVKG
ncbi:MAG: class I tRNA ligase family protein, partial [Deinococcota bacterium]|nr:class I tRNA ligase family protein [Deinococcota bacterium]